MRLLDAFEAVFDGQIYRHRSSTTGDHLARCFYEDLYALGRSAAFSQRVDEGRCVVNTRNRVTGKRRRRGDGTFGDRVVSVEPAREANFEVATGPTADIQVGVEVKILATAMVKQIDRVVGDLFKQAREFRLTTADAIPVAIVGVNHAPVYTSYEGDRSYDKPEDSGAAPADEADRAIRELDTGARPHFAELILLPFEATNRPPFPFAWRDRRQTLNAYTAACQRVLALYENRFG